LQFLFRKYAISEDITAWLMLAAGIADDILYLAMKFREKKRKEKEEKQKGKMEKIVDPSKAIEGIVQEGATA